MNRRRIIGFGWAVVLMVIVVGMASAQSSASYAIKWWVFSGDGAPAVAGDVSLNGSLGQTAIGPSSGSNVSLGAGYWYGAVRLSGEPGIRLLYLPVIFRSS